MKPVLTIRVSKALRNELLSVSKSEKIPISDIVRESIQRYLVTRKLNRLRKKVLPFAENAGLLTDEDVFKLVS